MTKEKITKETNIMQALDLNPDAAEILMEAGLGCIGCAFAQMESLGQGLMAHGFTEEEVDDVVERLNA
jgi:hybrid cluster-associated redox disulfide protein